MLLLLAIACTPYEPDPIPPVRTFDETGEPAETGHTGTEHTGDTGAPSLPPFDGPARLSEAGLYADLEGGVLAEGVLPYRPAWPLWSDGADKERWLRVPDGQTIDTSDPDHWVFPVGTKAFKEFTLDGVRLETRMVEKRADGWEFVSYAWRPDGTDADAVPDGVVDARGTSYDIPERADCFFCHVGPADLFLGVSAVQLGPGGQGGAALPVSAPVTGEIPGDAIEQAALGYMVGNCAHCHRDGTLAGDKSDLFTDIDVGLTDPALAPVLQTGLDASAQHLVEGTDTVIVAGDPEASQLWVRMGLRDLQAMPPRGSEQVDADGMAAVEAWIRALGTPPR